MPRGAIKLCGERRSSSSSDLKNGNDKHAHNDHDDDDDDHSHNDDHALVARIKYQFNGHRLMSVSLRPPQAGLQSPPIPIVAQVQLVCHKQRHSVKWPERK